MRGARFLVLFLFLTGLFIGCMETPGGAPWGDPSLDDPYYDAGTEAGTLNNQGQPSISELGQADTEGGHTDGEETPVYDDAVQPPEELMDENALLPDCDEIDSEEDEESFQNLTIHSPCQ